MKNWTQVAQAYKEDHLSKPLADAERRLSALSAIERVFTMKFPELLKDPAVFVNVTKPYLVKLYECLKGSPLSDAEKSVINGLYKFSL